MHTRHLWQSLGLVVVFLSVVSTSRKTHHSRHQARKGNNGGTLPLPHPFAASSGAPHLPSGRTTAGFGYYDREESKYALWEQQQTRRKEPRIKRPTSGSRDKKPNIILILADDQDIELGSMNFMPKALKILGEGGAHFPNAYVTTPMCCPSRSSLLTGLYVHNHNVYTNNDNCSSPMWQQEYETRTFATYLNNAGYRTAYFGKYLNEYNGSYIPPGWREWAGLIRNSRFYNYTINVNGNKIKHGDSYHHDYYPDLIANDSIAFLRQSKQYFVNKPVMMVLSFPTPHGPEDSAPQYHHLFRNVTTHRTPSWNFAPNPDKQWLLQHVGKMEPIHMQFTDVLHTKRLQTLQSMDDTVERLYKELVNLGELDNSYIFYTSDHGYHLGQFGLVKGKSMPFEFDIRVPFFVRGPKVPPGIKIQDIVLNLDLAPTFLDIGGVDVPEHMDGKSFLSIMSQGAKPSSGDGKRKKHWRDSFLVERGKTYKELHIPATSLLSTKEKLPAECQQPQYATPCQPYQKWECVYDGFRWRIRKCRGYLSHPKNNCVCSDVYPNVEDPVFEQYGESKSVQDDEVLFSPNASHNKKIRMDPLERRLQRRFLKEHVGKDFKPVFIGSRLKREVVSLDELDADELYQLSHILDLAEDNATKRKVAPERQIIETDVQSHSISTRSLPHQLPEPVIIAGGCHIWANSSITCPEDVYKDPRTWKEKKERLDNLIRKLRQKLDELKGIRRHLKKKRPSMVPFANNLPGPMIPTGRAQKCHCDFPDQNDFRYGMSVLDRRDERHTEKEDKLKKKERKLRRKAKFENTACNAEKMNCFSHDNEHWKTPPLWTYGPFCFCQNSNNNTYWCLRTINDTHNFLYCEFITGSKTFYNLKVDPYQLRNSVDDLDDATLEELRRHLDRLKNCKGGRECNQRYKPDSTGRDGGAGTRAPRRRHQGNAPIVGEAS